jgi:hypothetical protein
MAQSKTFAPLSNGIVDIKTIIGIKIEAMDTLPMLS